jgi:hypothetical protein
MRDRAVPAGNAVRPTRRPQLFEFRLQEAWSHSQRNTLVEIAVNTANSKSKATTFTQCAIHPDPSHTPFMSATA